MILGKTYSCRYSTLKYIVPRMYFLMHILVEFVKNQNFSVHFEEIG